MTKKTGLALLAGVALLSGVAGSAAARGCNGVVDQLRWGCAYWDNNNGPKYPYYNARQTHVAGLNVPEGTRLKVSGNNLIDASSGRIVASGAGNVIAAGGGNVIAVGGGNVIAAGGGN